jgi:hypothetical protein
MPRPETKAEIRPPSHIALWGELGIVSPEPMLASDEATYVTGTEVNIDGGLLAGSAASPG